VSALRGSIALLATAVAVFGSCGGDAIEEGGENPASSEPPSSTTVLWRALGEWTGKGDRQTESFEIASGALRLMWSAQDEDQRGARTLRVSLHSAISGRPLETIVDGVGAGSDTVRLTAGPRVAYLLIESSGLDWRVGLEEGVASHTRGTGRDTAR
jgi:hypothetical protein